MLTVDLLGTGGVELESTPVVKVTELVELFCVFPEIYNGQYEYINLHSYMFELFRNPEYSLWEETQKKMPLFDALKAYYSLIVIEQIRQGVFKPVALHFDLPNNEFAISEGSANDFTASYTRILPKTLLDYVSKVKESTYWVHFFNTLRRHEDEIRNKYRDTNS